MELPEPFRWEGEHIAADLPAPTCCSAPAAAGSPRAPFDSLNLGRLTADPRPNVDENRARLAAAVGHPARALPLRPPGPRHHRAPRDRAAERRPAGRRGGRPGDRPTGRRGARVRRRLPAGRARRRRRRGDAALRLAAAGRRDDRRGRRRAARARRRRPGRGRRSARAPRAAATRSARRSTSTSRTSPRPGTASATSTCRRSPAPSSRAAGVDGGPRRRPVHAVPHRPVLLPPRRRRDDGAPGGGRVARLITGLDAAPRARERRAHPRRRSATPSCWPRSSTSRWRSSRRSPRPASRCWARTAPRTSRPRPRRTPACSAGTSSASSRAARSR